MTDCQLAWPVGVDGYAGLKHRKAYERAHGPIPPGMHVTHTCDVRNCVNPAHLKIATHAQNMADKVARGRSRGRTEYYRAGAGIMVRNVDESLWYQLRLEALKRHISMGALLTLILKEWLERKS